LSLAPGTDTAIVFGAGLGYAVEAALVTGGIDAVIVCEASPPRLAALLSARDLSGLLGDERLSWLVGGDPGGILAALEDLGTRKSGILALRSLEAFEPEWYEALRSAVERFSSKESINENTLRRFGRLWVRNLARNAGALAGLPGINGLAGLFEGIPALVVAAGPSLDEVLPRLGEIRERCLLVAVDTALRSLLGRGIEPDFLVVVDPQYWNWRHLADLESPSSLLVSEPAVWPSVLRKPHRRAFLASSLFPLGRALDQGERGLLGAGGSVATSAWDLARHLGASPIYMAGLDLGYPVGHTHAKASLFEQRALGGGTRLAPSTSAQAAALFSAPSKFVPSNDGGSVLSDQRMTLYAWWFESRLARAGATPTRNLSRQGSAIPGMPYSGLDELCGLSPRRGAIDELLSRAAALEPPEGARTRGEKAMASLVTELGRIAELAELGKKAAAKARLCIAAGSDASGLIGELDLVDETLHGSEARDVAGFFLPPLSELLGARPRSLAESLLSSEGIYGKIAESAREHLAILSRLGSIGVGASGSS
ncbi:MAG: 6-hydroxymethylpterin diphosphokinase MptE-like protein, partial [Spirochaetota bacterium]